MVLKSTVSLFLSAKFQKCVLFLTDPHYLTIIMGKQYI